MNNHPFSVQRGSHVVVVFKDDSPIASLWGVVMSADNIGISLNTVGGQVDTNGILSEITLDQKKVHVNFIPLDSISYVKVVEVNE